MVAVLDEAAPDLYRSFRLRLTHDDQTQRCTNTLTAQPAARSRAAVRAPRDHAGL